MKHIFRITTIAFLIAALISCSKAFVTDQDMIIDGDVILHISGCVIDKTSDTPLEGIKIQFKAEQKNHDNGSIPEQTVYTDNTGMYTIKADDFQGTLKCTITATDPDDIYSPSSQELIVTWSTMTEHGNAYFYNDCNFFLMKK